MLIIFRHADEHFDLVMISERMDESMVLMAEALCLPLEDVTSLKNNARKKDKVPNMTDDDKAVISRFQRADQARVCFISKLSNYELLHWASTTSC